MFIGYQAWQPRLGLRALQRRHFSKASARMQWWYFDVAMGDGSVLVVAFMPRKWWRDSSEARTEDAFLFAALMTPDRKVRSIGRAFESASLRCSQRSVEVPGQFSIAFDPDSPRGPAYRLSFDISGLQGRLEIARLSPPFSPLPAGRKPGIFRTLFEGAGLGASDFTYVAQVPRGSASGTIVLGSRRVEVHGWAYHEQGRLDEPAEALSGGWLWFHFLHPEWSVFGNPGTFIHAQKEDRVLLSGVSLPGHPYALQKPSLIGEGSHPGVYAGGVIALERGGLKLRITADPATATNLISFPAAATRQTWSTSVAAAELEVEDGGKTEKRPGQVILETCWLGA